MKKLLDHLKIETEEGRLRCIEKHSGESFHRQKHQQEDPYTEELHEILTGNIVTANKLLRENLGLELPLAKYEFFKASQ